MPPIPVHIDDPIVPQKSQGVTPQTPATANPETASATNSEQGHKPGYPAAHPGQAAVPAPTPYIPRPSPEPSRTVLASTVGQYGPSPPQPGAVPVPFSSSSQGVGTLPPPPKPGETLQQLNQSQFMSTPNQTNDHQQSSSEHPPGYQQNIYAQDLSPAQRSSLEQETRKESVAAQFVFRGENFGAPSSASGDGSMSETAGQAWNMAKGWLSTAGQKLAETEESVWKKINGEK